MLFVSKRCRQADAARAAMRNGVDPMQQAPQMQPARALKKRMEFVDHNRVEPPKQGLDARGSSHEHRLDRFRRDEHNTLR